MTLVHEAVGRAQNRVLFVGALKKCKMMIIVSLLRLFRFGTLSSFAFYLWLCSKRMNVEDVEKTVKVTDKLSVRQDFRC